MEFKLLGATSNEETLAVGSEIREIKRLIKAHGDGRWRKRKGIGRVRLSDGTTKLAELHWYEAHEIGRRGYKIKRYLA